MKTRIKHIVLNGGLDYYIPEFKTKWMWFWCPIVFFSDTNSIGEIFAWLFDDSTHPDYMKPTLDGAKYVINKYTDDRNWRKAKNTVKVVETIKYP